MESNQELIKITEDLIKFKSEKSNYDELKNCVNYIKNYFNDCKNIIIKEFEHNKKPSLVISFKDTKHFDLLLNGHIDIVDAEDSQFIPKLEDNKLFGRGSIDMKGGVAACMLIMKELSKNENPSNVGLMIVSDEEIGGFDGTNYLVNTENYTCDFAIAAEPTHTDSPDKLAIVISEKGVLLLKIYVKGKSAHGSRPWLGENAIEKLINKFHEIKKLFNEASANDNWKITINLSKFNAGTAYNKVPDHAELYLDIRYTEDTSIDEILEKINQIKDINIEVIESSSILTNEDNNEKILSFKSAIETITNNTCELIKECGASDLRFTSEKGMTSVICGPLGANYHGDGEFIYVNSLLLYFNCMIKFINDNY